MGFYYNNLVAAALCSAVLLLQLAGFKLPIRADEERHGLRRKKRKVLMSCSIIRNSSGFRSIRRILSEESDLPYAWEDHGSFEVFKRTGDQ